MDVMEKAIFYVDFCFEAGSDEYGCNVSGRYQFGLELTDDEYEELYQIWYDQNELNSWTTEWDGHEALYQKINGVAVYALDKYLEQCQRYGIFLSFTTDPMIDETRELTSIAISEATVRDIPVWVLTKCSTFIYDECNFMAWMEAINPIYRDRIHFGFTLTGCDDMEPKANTNADRIMAMRRMHLMGFSTFASIEPVIDWQSAERVVREAMTWCDHFKLGLRSGVKKDYYNIAESGAAIMRIVQSVESFGKTIYLKESTRKLLQQYLQPGAYEAFLSHTVDLDGNRITL